MWGKHNKKKKILIVDDNAINIVLLKEMIETIETTTPEVVIDIAYNGEEGLRSIKSESYDIIFLDIYMPILTGLDVLKVLKEEGRKENIIILSADNSIETINKAKILGAKDYITKPINLFDLDKKLKEV